MLRHSICLQSKWQSPNHDPSTPRGHPGAWPVSLRTVNPTVRRISAAFRAALAATVHRGWDDRNSREADCGDRTRLECLEGLFGVEFIRQFDLDPTGGEEAVVDDLRCCRSQYKVEPV